MKSAAQIFLLNRFRAGRGQFGVCLAGLVLVCAAPLFAGGFPELIGHAPFVGASMPGLDGRAGAIKGPVALQPIAMLQSERERNQEWRDLIVRVDRRTELLFLEKRRVEDAWQNPRTIQVSRPAGRWRTGHPGPHCSQSGGDQPLLAGGTHRLCASADGGDSNHGAPGRTIAGLNLRAGAGPARLDYYSLRNGYIRRGGPRAIYSPASFRATGVLSPDLSRIISSGALPSAPITLGIDPYKPSPYVVYASRRRNPNQFRGPHAYFPA